jgi:hypothetical protein
MGAQRSRVERPRLDCPPCPTTARENLAEAPAHSKGVNQGEDLPYASSPVRPSTTASPRYSASTSL